MGFLLQTKTGYKLTWHQKDPDSCIVIGRIAVVFTDGYEDWQTVMNERRKFAYKTRQNANSRSESGIMHALFIITGEYRMAKATARHILVDTEEKCQTIKDEIAGGADFADLAKQHSSCPSGQQGGDLGDFGPGMMVKEFDEVVFSADVNTVQGPVQTQFGYHLLEVTSRTD